MIPDPKNPHPDTESVVIEILSRTPRLTVKELYAQFQKKSPKKLTLQGLYHLLAELQKKRIIVKDGRLLSIDAGWIHTVIDFGQRLRSTYLEANPTTANILVLEGESNSFEFPTVMDMDNFWLHALVIVAHYSAEQKHSDANVYNYNDHCWFQVIRVGSEQTLGEIYRQLGMDWYLVAGSLSYIDGLVSSIIRGAGFHYSQSETAGFPENYYVVVIGDFIFETALPKYVYEMMESVYDRVHAVTDPAVQSIEDVIRLPAKTQLTISRDARRAEQIRSRIKKVFKTKTGRRGRR